MSERLSLWYRRFGPAIFARCRRLLRNEAAAEDAMHEVFIRTLKHEDKILNDEDALRWLYRVSTNYCLNQIRNHKRRTEKAIHIPDRSVTDPREWLVDSECVRSLVGHMPEKLTTPAILYYLDEMDQSEIAEVLNCSRRTVLYRLESFREKAKKLLEASPG